MAWEHRVFFVGVKNSGTYLLPLPSALHDSRETWHKILSPFQERQYADAYVLTTIFVIFNLNIFPVTRKMCYWFMFAFLLLLEKLFTERNCLLCISFEVIFTVAVPLPLRCVREALNYHWFFVSKDWHFWAKLRCTRWLQKHQCCIFNLANKLALEKSAFSRHSGIMVVICWWKSTFVNLLFWHTIKYYPRPRESPLALKFFISVEKKVYCKMQFVKVKGEIN